MERVAFLIEETGERLGCLLNPETLVVRRVAGLRQRRSLGGHVTGTGQSDDALLYTGGGTTELRLDLLFDVYVAGSSIQTEDVRELTAPLWRLAENASGDDYGKPPLARFIWGKAWNVPGVVAAVSERLERFTPGGAPTRSWLRMRLLRTEEPPPPAPAVRSTEIVVPPPESVPEDQVEFYDVVGSGQDPDGGLTGERLDQIALRVYGDAGLWKVLALFNGIDDPLRLPAGLVLRIPSRAVLEGLA
jgi:hypothetical protein